MAFFKGLYLPASETCGDAVESAVRAGIKPKVGMKWAEQTLAAYRKKNFAELMDSMGVDKIAIGLRLKSILETGSDKEASGVARLLLANAGEVTDKGGERPTMEFKAPTIIYMGADSQMLQSLKRGGRPSVEEPVPDLDEADASGPVEAAS